MEINRTSSRLHKRLLKIVDDDVVFACSVGVSGSTSNSAVGGCYPHGAGFNPNLANSPIVVTAICAKNLVDSTSRRSQSDSNSYNVVSQEELDTLERLRQQVDSMYESLSDK